MEPFLNEAPVGHLNGCKGQRYSYSAQQLEMTYSALAPWTRRVVMQSMLPARAALWRGVSPT